MEDETAACLGLTKVGVEEGFDSGSALVLMGDRGALVFKGDSEEARDEIDAASADFERACDEAEEEEAETMRLGAAADEGARTGFAL